MKALIKSYRFSKTLLICKAGLVGMASAGPTLAVVSGSDCAFVPGGDVLDCDAQWSSSPSPAVCRAPNSPGERLRCSVLHLARGLQQSTGNLPQALTPGLCPGQRGPSVILCSEIFSASSLKKKKKEAVSIKFVLRAMKCCSSRKTLPPGP